MRDIHKELLEAMGPIRAVLRAEFNWFIHETAIKYLPSIRAHGLLPKDPEAICVPNVVLEKVGRKIVCLHPFAATMRPYSSQPPPHCLLALSSDDLPMRLGLDPSHTGCLAEVDKILSRCPTLSPAELLLRVAKELGSVASFDKVPISVLKVCSKDDPCNDPSMWKPLSDVPDDQVKPLNENIVF